MQEGKATLVAAVVGATVSVAAATVATCCCAVAMAVGLFAAATAVCASAFGVAAVAPAVCGALVGWAVVSCPGAHAANIAALAAPNSASASRRLRTRPMGRSSSACVGAAVMVLGGEGRGAGLFGRVLIGSP